MRWVKVRARRDAEALGLSAEAIALVVSERSCTALCGTAQGPDAQAVAVKWEKALGMSSEAIAELVRALEKEEGR